MKKLIKKNVVHNKNYYMVRLYAFEGVGGGNNNCIGNGNCCGNGQCCGNTGGH
mgnify:CR=1 FL=1